MREITKAISVLVDGNAKDFRLNADASGIVAAGRRALSELQSLLRTLRSAVSP